jgi:hypothetical protein
MLFFSMFVWSQKEFGFLANNQSTSWIQLKFLLILAVAFKYSLRSRVALSKEQDFGLDTVFFARLLNVNLFSSAIQCLKFCLPISTHSANKFKAIKHQN